jgi:hypothetical protein
VNSLLNTHQRRRLEVTLYLVEQGLDEIAGYLRGELPAGEMYKTVSDLSFDERTEMLAHIDEAKQQIAKIKSDFGLDPRTNDLRGMIMGYLSSLWESLHNTRPRNLKGFGPVAPGLDETLDPELIQIIGRINTMLAVISRNRKGGS